MRRRLMKTSVVTPILLALFFVGGGQAFGQIDPQAVYHIVAKHSGKCLDVTGGPNAIRNGVQVIQRQCNEESNQQWTFTSVGDDYYKILARHSGKSLDVSGGPYLVHNGIEVKQWEYHSGSNQMWRLIPVGGDGDYRIVAKHSGRSLDINGGPGAMGDGALAQQWDYVGGDNQKFRLINLKPAPCARADSITSTFAGPAELTVQRISGRPFMEPIDLRIDFTQCRANVRITSFPPITTQEFPVLGHPNRTTVSLIAGGSGIMTVDRTIRVPVTLHLQHSLEMDPDPNIAQRAVPSDLTLTLEGQVSLSGEVTFVGSGTFMGGYLDNSRGLLRVTGRLTPSP
jgi:hypothetical protein